MAVKIKICGITRRADAQAALEAGADLLGFNFYPASPRYITPAAARAIVSELGAPALSVGLFVNPIASEVLEASAAADVSLVQLHGDESPDFCAALGRPVIKAWRPSSLADLDALEQYRVWAMLLDAPSEKFGGSGKQADWELATEAARRCPRLILAGGLNPDNVADAIKIVRPWAVDVASGVESAPGIKDHDKIKRFIEAVKNGS